MLSKDFNSHILLDNGIELIYDIDLFFLNYMNNCLTEKDKIIISSVITKQYLLKIKDIIRNYNNSLLPQKFIKNQKIYAMILDGRILGIFNLMGDDIIVDVNALFGNYNDINASFLFGHEMGHKIAKYKDVLETYREIACTLGISLDGNYPLITETFADECGNLVSPSICEHGILPTPLDTNKREVIKKLILQCIYKV